MSIEQVARVAVFRDPEVVYPSEAPFGPPLEYPEYPFKGKSSLDGTNRVYGAVRSTLRLLGLDEANFGTAEWNPLGGLVAPGDRVAITPNLVLDYHINSESILSVLTHGSVVRAIADYVEIALRGEGRILFADAPLFNADFDKVVELTGLAGVAKFYKESSRVETALMDLRQVRTSIQHGVVVDRQIVDTHETESVIVDLGQDSMMLELGQTVRNLFGADYDRRETCSHHNMTTNRYCLSKRVLESNVLISVAKLKTHRKTGVTLGLKNLVGINTNKNYLPHYRVGDALEGGDEFPIEKSKILRLKSRLVRKAIDCVLARRGRAAAGIASVLLPVLFPVKKEGEYRSEQPQIDAFYERFLHKSVRMGSWEKNDTAWRMVLDIARAFFYADLRGQMQSSRQRRLFVLVDGIIGGDGNGPTAPRPRSEGVLVAGVDPVAVDITSARLMGFDPDRISIVAQAGAKHRFSLGNPDNIQIRTNWDSWKDGITAGESLRFLPPDNWDGIVAWRSG